MKALARSAYRGMQTDDDVGTLLAFYEQGRADGDFESGIEIAIERLLADPKFIYRAEHEPADGAPGTTYTGIWLVVSSSSSVSCSGVSAHE